jgi:hypothetical protein
MSRNCSPCTVTPDFPIDVCSDELIERLSQAGFSHYEGYFYAEEGTSEDYFNDETGKLETNDWGAIFAEMMFEAGLLEVVIEGAIYCDKMRQGEFGGYVIRITPDGIQYGGTYSVIERMREGRWK